MNRPKTIMFIYEGFVIIGGIETFILRLCKWYKNNGHRLILARTKFLPIENAMMEELRRNDVEIIEVKRVMNNRLGDNAFYDLKNFNIDLNMNESLIIISFDYLAFALGEKIKEQYKNNEIDNIFYVTHPFEAYRDEKIKVRYAKMIYKRFYKKIAEQMVLSNSIVFMSELCAQEFSKRYNFKYLPEELCIVRLGMCVEEFDESLVRQRFNSGKFVILLMSRFDLPMYGNLIGIINTYKELRDMKKMVSLNIIGYGPDESIIKQKIRELPEEYKDEVNMVGKIEYDQINKYIQKANVFVGTGTALLDAVNMGVPGIVATIYKEDSSCYGQFVRDFRNLGGSDGERKIIDEILRVLNCTIDEYTELCRVTHKVYSDNYNVDIIANKLLSCENRQAVEPITKAQFIIINTVGSIVNSIRKTVKGMRKKTGGENDES